ncbi:MULTISPECIES: hypothetical protein [unclassified Streptomyces]|uniref:hypothetical protein n=1 Tax=unclassified Streptomyces TaxID=2593676 RepID=UPI0027428DE8|nr:MULTISPECIES: hypothetical protein [unclassified Streptomyces]
MSEQVLYGATAGGFAWVSQAPASHELHAPATRAPAVSVPHLMGLRTSAARPHRRKVPLRRLTSALG